MSAILTSRGMPRNVAMQQPDTGVIRFKRDGDVAASGHEHHVAARRVDEVEGRVAVDWVEGGVLLSEDDDIHPVPVQWMGHCHLCQSSAKESACPKARGHTDH